MSTILLGDKSDARRRLRVYRLPELCNLTGGLLAILGKVTVLSNTFECVRIYIRMLPSDNCKIHHLESACQVTGVADN